MKIYIFNPEHDIALASNLEHFTAPHAGRELRHDLGFLPVLWAGSDDYVLVDDIESAEEGIRKLGLETISKLTDAKGLAKIASNTNERFEFRPWGWDLSIRQNLKNIGIRVSDLPTNPQLNAIRNISNRSWAAENLLRPLHEIASTTGHAELMQDEDNIRLFLSKYHNIVLKAPWSSSGRGIRYVSDSKKYNTETYCGITPQLSGWIRNIILRQGGIMAEPYYNKVLDFGMEFNIDGNGIVKYCGLSLFHTVNGAYTGNIIDDEGHKISVLSHYIPISIISDVCAKSIEILTNKLKGHYSGPLGIDMMLVHNGQGITINPCVELNLRMTMGHVAILLNKRYGIELQSMRIVYSNGKYSFSRSKCPVARFLLD